jgi:Putative transposase DNA-binding domain
MRTAYRVERCHPSSKTCSRCSPVKTTLARSQREFVAANRALVIDRDLNAAINPTRIAQGHLAGGFTPGSGSVETGGAGGRTRHGAGGQPLVLAPGTWHLAPGTWHLAPGNETRTTDQEDRPAARTGSQMTETTKADRPHLATAQNRREPTSSMPLSAS